MTDPRQIRRYTLELRKKNAEARELSKSLREARFELDELRPTKIVRKKLHVLHQLLQRALKIRRDGCLVNEGRS